MATQPSNDTSELLKYQTCVLRVSIHCEGCKKKVHKILHNIDGVFTVSIDSQENKVSVTGNVEAEKLIKKLEKAGKHAQILHEKVPEGENKTGKSKKKKKNNKKTDPDIGNKASGDEDEDQENIREKKEENDNDENDAENEKPNPTNNGAKKKKKKKGKKGNSTEGANIGDAPASTESFPASETLDPPFGMMHLGPPYGHVYSYPAQPFGVSYNTTHPSITSSYYRPPPPSDRIRLYEINHRDEVYVGNDDEGGCSVM